MLQPNPRANAGSAEATASLQLSQKNVVAQRRALIGVLQRDAAPTAQG
jgi:hypothetical protein